MTILIRHFSVFFSLKNKNVSLISYIHNRMITYWDIFVVSACYFCYRFLKLYCSLNKKKHFFESNKLIENHIPKNFASWKWFDRYQLRVDRLILAPPCPTASTQVQLSVLGEQLTLYRPRQCPAGGRADFVPKQTIHSWLPLGPYGWQRTIRQMTLSLRRQSRYYT